MRSRIYSCLFCVCLIVSFPVLSFAQSADFMPNNLLTNGDFENGINSWNVLGPNWIPETTVVQQGTISAKNTIGTIPNNDYYAGLNQVFPFGSSQNVYVTLYVKTNIDARSFARAGVLVEFLNSVNAVIGTVQDEIGGNTDWRQLYAAGTSPVGTVRARYSVFVFASQAETTPPNGIAIGGLAYFDDAVLSTTPIAPPVRPAHLANTGFENGFVDWDLVFQPAFSVDDQNATQGSFSAKSVINVGSQQDFFSAAYQDLRYLSGPVFASAKIKTAINPASTGLAEVKLEFYDRFDPAPTVQPLGTAQSTLRGNNNWTTSVINGTGSGVTPPTGTVMVRVLVLTYAQRNDTSANGGVANFDEVVFSYNPLPPQNRTDILNKGFENGLNSWSEQFGFPAIVQIGGRTGSFSAKKVIGAVPNNDYYSQIYQDIYFNAAATPWPLATPVSAEVYVKTNMNPTTKAQAGLQMEFIDIQGQVIRDLNNQPILITDKVGGQTPNWRRVYVVSKTPPGTVRVRVSGYEFSRQQEAHLGGQGLYDDFDFSKQTVLPPPPDRLYLLNPGFENGLNDWDELYKPGEVSTTVKRTGNYSAVFTVDNEVISGRDYFAMASQDVDVKAGDVLTVKGWVKTDITPATLGVAGILVWLYDQNGQQAGLYYTPLIGGRTNWTQVSTASFIIPAPVLGSPNPQFITKMRVACAVYVPWFSSVPGDKVYFDDIEVTSP